MSLHSHEYPEMNGFLMAEVEKKLFLRIYQISFSQVRLSEPFPFDVSGYKDLWKSVFERE